MNKKEILLRLCDIELKIRQIENEKKSEYFNSLDIEELRKLAEPYSLAEKILCERSLADFGERAWCQIDPTKFIREWYFDLMCRAMEEVYYRNITRLIITIPPGCAKSMSCSVFYPVWCWLKDPSLSLLTGGARKELAEDSTVKSRDLIKSEWFQFHWSENFKFKDDQNQKSNYVNDKHGKRRAFSVKSGVTGKRADMLILDDPLDAKDTYSKPEREQVKFSISNVLGSRLNDPIRSPIVVVMQRLHVDDPVSFLLKTGDWTLLRLPMLYDSKNPTILNFGKDIRKEEGEILTKRHNEHTISEIRKRMSSYDFSAQYQQTVQAREGGIIKEADIQYYKELPNLTSLIWSWDTASKKEDINDYTVGVLIGVSKDSYYIIDLVRKKIEFPELSRTLINCSNKSPANKILIEDKSSGTQLLQTLRRETRLPLIAIVPGKNGVPKTKTEKMIYSSPLFESHRVFLKEGAEWAHDFIDEMVGFPEVRHDDICDAVSQALCYLIAKENRMPFISIR